MGIFVHWGVCDNQGDIPWPLSPPGLSGGTFAVHEQQVTQTDRTEVTQTGQR